MENCGSAVVVVIGFFGPSLLPLEITDGGLEEDHGILETSQAPVAVVAQETSERPVSVVVVHGELAALAIATTVTIWAATNGTFAALLFKESFVLAEVAATLLETACLAG